MLVLIDGDSIAYKAASCANEDVVYMRSIVQSEMGQILEACGTFNYELWVEDPIEKNIFRNKIAVTKKYKGNRVGRPAPTLLLEAKLHMLSFWNAKTTSVFEAEDMVIRRAYQEGLDNVIVAAIDKDVVKNFPIKFYNYRTEEFTKLTEEEATANLWRQVATGDSTDNIPGIPRVGEKKAAHLTNMMDCVKMYIERGMSYKYFLEQYNLIYIRKEEHTGLIYPLTKREWDEVQEGEV